MVCDNGVWFIVKWGANALRSEYNANSEVQFSQSERMWQGGSGPPPKSPLVLRERKSLWRISFAAGRTPQPTGYEENIEHMLCQAWKLE